MAEAATNFREALLSTPINGRYLFREDFDNLADWNTSGTVTVLDSILNLDTGASVASKRKFLGGTFVFLAKTTTANNLQIGLTDDAGVNYVVWSNGNLRFKSTVDASEGTVTAAATDTNYNIFEFVWQKDVFLIRINGSTFTTTPNLRVPNKPLNLTVKNLGAGTCQADYIVAYPEPIATTLTTTGVTATSTLATPIVGTTGTNRLGVVCFNARLLAAPYLDTTTPINANTSYLGTSRDTQISSSSPFDHHEFISAVATADVAGILIIQESVDGSTWNTMRSVATASVTNPDGSTQHAAVVDRHSVIQRYVRVAYRNGATNQTTFRLSSRVYTG